jgi:hypothetical protein
MRTIGLIVCLALAACGNNSDNGLPSLVGTWKSPGTDVIYTIILGGADSAGTAYISYTSAHSNNPADPQATCVAFQRGTGTFTAANSQLTVTLTSGTQGTNSCTDATNNIPETPLTAAQLTQLDLLASGTYTVSANLLVIISGGMPLSYTRH